jgi:HAD superfamily hydrolase (TIGR01459 family)
MHLLSGLSEIVDQFDACLVDQYGVLHDGRSIFPAAAACLDLLRKAGKEVIVLTNSGKRAAPNIERLLALGLRRDAFSDLLSSGELTWNLLRERSEPFFAALGGRCHLIVRPADRGFLDGLAIEPVERVAEATFLLLISIDQISDGRAFEALLRDAAQRGLPMVCANPDTLTVVAGEPPVPGPGAAALDYRWHGGPVHFVGKPHRAIFEAAQRRARVEDPSRILVIGDSMGHDILGGSRAGFKTLLVGAGVHAPEILRDDGMFDGDVLSDLCRREGIAPDFAIPRLAA